MRRVRSPVRVHWYTMCRQSRSEWPDQRGGMRRVCTAVQRMYSCARVHRYTMSR